ncbi:DNA polymerase III subunit delta' [Lactococcus termiticola]|uniref:DNA polymerase III subunit delta n=1 Tax=Lactococcus termiticola TaxID=2169526 RepID=A0A2R5HEH6_9LACT|nr:DNA polymerase III subunit delta' [Lactococcus termiticola]GBG96477.1 DNA polymerase III subunit delta' [Lactococcus termiticola]
MKLAEIQRQILGQFQQVIASHRLSHAYLFAGSFGSFEMSLYLAQSCFCENKTADGLPCEQCRACRLVADLEFADLHIIEPEGQSIKAEQIRALSEVFSRTGMEGSQIVVIIRQAEKMNATAANALLKSMEEARSEVHIFLLTENENLILPTIRSRSQLVKFPKNIAYMESKLEEAGLLKSQASLLAQLTSTVDEALSLAKAVWFIDGQKKLQHWTDLIASQKLDEAYLYLGSLLEVFDDKAKQQLALEMTLNLLHQKGQKSAMQKAFKAIKYWKQNVNFESSLSLIVL